MSYSSGSSGYTGSGSSSSGTSGTGGTGTYNTTQTSATPRPQSPNSPAKQTGPARSPRRDHHVKEKYNVINVPADRVQQAGLANNNQWANGWGNGPDFGGYGYTNQTTYRCTTPYQKINYTYNYKQQYPSPQYGSQAYHHQYQQYPVPQMSPYYYYNTGSYGYAGPAYPYATGPTYGYNQQTDRQRQQQPERVHSIASNVSTEEQKRDKQIGEMKDELASMRKLINKEMTRYRAAQPPPVGTTPPAPRTDPMKYDKLVDRFNQLVGQFEQATGNLYREVPNARVGSQHRPPQQQQSPATYTTTMSDAFGATKSPGSRQRFNEQNEFDQDKTKRLMTEVDEVYERAHEIAAQLHNQILSSLRLRPSNEDGAAAGGGNNQRQGSPSGSGSKSGSGSASGRPSSL